MPSSTSTSTRVAKAMRPIALRVIACAAVLTTLGGTAYAAAKITGADVRDGSLTGRDVRDGSLSGRDLRDRSLQASHFGRGQLPAGPRGPAGQPGARGPEGRAGPRGATGAQGERGPSEAISSFDPSTTPLSSSSVVVERVAVPSGSWVVNVTGSLDSAGPEVRLAGCELRADGTRFAAVDSIRVDALGEASIALTGAATFADSGLIELECASATSTVVIGGVSLTAVRVAELDDRSGD